MTLRESLDKCFKSLLKQARSIEKKGHLDWEINTTTEYPNSYYLSSFGLSVLVNRRGNAKVLINKTRSYSGYGEWIGVADLKKGGTYKVLNETQANGQIYPEDLPIIENMARELGNFLAFFEDSCCEDISLDKNIGITWDFSQKKWFLAKDETSPIKHCPWCGKFLPNIDSAIVKIEKQPISRFEKLVDFVNAR